VGSAKVVFVSRCSLKFAPLRAVEILEHSLRWRRSTHISAFNSPLPT
jgi:hypothetical protein